MELKSLINYNQKYLANLKLPPHSAGRLITTRVPIVLMNETIKQVQEQLFKNSSDIDTFNYIYVIDLDQKLHGAFSLNEIFKAPPETVVKDLIDDNLVVGHPTSDREHIAHLALKHNLKAIPIVDHDRHFLGVVASDQILLTLYHEQREDMLKSAGIVPHEENFDSALSLSITKSFLHRTPWIILGLIGGVLAAQVVSSFEHILANQVALASFIPLIAYISAAVGAQTQTLLIRDLAFNSGLPFVKYGLRQLIVSTLIAGMCALSTWLIVFIIWQSSHLGAIVSISVGIAIISSTAIAIIVPFLLILFHQDPADGSGPFANVIQDIISIIIYFFVATTLLG